MQALDPDALKSALTERQISRSALCKLAGLSPSYLSRILNGKVPLTEPALIQRLTSALGIEPAPARSMGPWSPLRVAASPHLWSAPLLNQEESGGQGPFTVLARDQSATGHDALLALRKQRVDLALAFETPLSMVEAADVLTLGSLCTGSDYVRLLVHLGSPLLDRFEAIPSHKSSNVHRNARDKQTSAWLEDPTIALREETIVGDYLQHLEESVNGFDKLRAVAANPESPWLDMAGNPIHLILTWEPLASAIIAASGEQFVDVLAKFAGELPTRWLPRLTEYQILVSRQRPLPVERLREVIGQLADAVKAMNHLSSKSRLVLQSQPVVERLAGTLPFPLPNPAQSTFRRLLAQRLASTRFQLRLWPEVVTTGLL